MIDNKCYECDYELEEIDLDKGICPRCGAITSEDYFDGE